MTTIATPADALREVAESSPDAPAIVTVDGPHWSGGRLQACLDAISEAIRDHGVERRDRVAVLLPAGPLPALAFLGASQAAVAAPLNPSLTAAELAYLIDDLDAKLLVTIRSDEVEKVVSTTDRDVPILDLGPALVDLPRQPGTVVQPSFRPAPNDIALVLHTSGTTSRPKLVPLTHSNLLTSARNIATSCELSPVDRAFNVMPLFHIHGLMASVLASLTTGASVVCAPGFDPSNFLAWLRMTGATWYSAVPTIHQRILAEVRSSNHPTFDHQHALRFIRSSSASLPAPVMKELESTFDVPVIEAYGMTEASHQIASNPLPPHPRKSRSVGPPAGPDVAILSNQAAHSDLVRVSSEQGEILIRGENVTSGYHDAPEANAHAFTDGWLRTGDIGWIDDDGYVHITGRIKEMINRAGEKIAPSEIEDVLLTHPAVMQAAAFALPHPELGEDVAAAVVLRPGSTVTRGELLEAARSQLAYFKLPRRLVMVDQLPKGPTGKLQRSRMAAQLNIEFDAGRPDPAQFRSPAPGLESEIAQVYQAVLGLERVGALDDYLLLGGDSIGATRIVGRLEEVVGARLSLAAFFEAGTIERVAIELAKLRAGRASPELLARLLDSIEADDNSEPASDDPS